MGAVVAASAQWDPAPVNILVVDDHAENRLALRAILSAPEYRILEAGSDREALRHLLREDCAVILLDVVMPGVDGFELARLIKQRERAATIPILFLTAEAVDAAMVHKAYSVGAADYLVKPLLPEIVRSKVAVFAELYRQRRCIEAQSELLLEAERERHEAHLLELRLASERRYRNLAEAVPHIVWTAQPDGRVDYFNRRWFEHTGLTDANARGSWLAALHPDDRADCEAGWRTSLASGQAFERECRLRRHDGSYRWQLCRALPEHGVGGDVVSWLGTFTDVDDQKQVQSVLAEFKAMLDAVLDAVLIFDAGEEGLIYANQGASRLLGYPRGQLQGLSPGDVLPALADQDPQAMLAPLDDHKTTLETTCRRQSGHEVPVELSLQLVDHSGGRIIAIARDITRRKHSEATQEFLYRKALDAIQARDDFLSIASHELRTPLTSLSLQLHTLDRLMQRSEESVSADTISHKVELAGQQVARLVRLMDALLDVSRISGGQFVIEYQSVDLAALVRDVVDRLDDNARRAGSVIRLAGAETLPGEWDGMRLEQVITNLLTNALKFGAGKPVDVTVCRDGEEACLTVRDHGIGIDEDARVRIFQRFERATASHAYTGLGLGLYITRQIVEAHGGHIDLDSTSGEGAAFSVRLPLAPATPKAASADPSGEVPDDLADPAD